MKENPPHKPGENCMKAAPAAMRQGRGSPLLEGSKANAVFDKKPSFIHRIRHDAGARGRRCQWSSVHPSGSAPLLSERRRTRR